MTVSSYLTVAGDGTAEITVSRSRFLCTLARVADEPGARDVIDQTRRQHWDAQHHCFAFVVGPERVSEQLGDDGEPPGTGGAPMLELLRGRELSDVVVVTSRWFGGTMLGTGPLSRAYADATRAALEQVGVRRRELQDVVEVLVDISAVGRLEHALRGRGARVLGVEYTGDALLRFAVPPRARPVADEIVAELTEGTADLRMIGQEWVDSDG